MRTLNKFFIVLIAVGFYSCEDILEKDITDENVVAVSPLDNAQISGNAVTFQWNDVDGAESYRLQVFSSVQSIVLDSLVTSTSFSYPLNPGEYQWRVRGHNFAYETAYTFPLDFSVLQTTDLTNQQVFLSNPSDAFYTNSGILTFTWQELAAADYYDFQLINITNGQTVVYSENGLIGNSVSLEDSVINNINAEYQWKVRARNGNGQTVYTFRSFKFDNIAPNQSQNTAPVNNTTAVVNAPIDFSWTIPADSGIIQSPISYTIEFANDISFTSIIQTSDAATNSTSHTFYLAGDYYWRIKAKDAAGNHGGYSLATKVTVN
jgi:hypothetical protein